MGGGSFYPATTASRKRDAPARACQICGIRLGAVPEPEGGERGGGGVASPAWGVQRH